MSKKWLAIVVLVLVAAGGYYLYTKGEIGKPTADVTDITLTNISLTSTRMDIEVVVHNPNPVGATVGRIDYDVYYLEDGDLKLLGSGTRGEDVHIGKSGDTTFTVPFEATNVDIVKALYEFAMNRGNITVKVDGSVYIDLKATSFEVAFSRRKTVSVQV